MSFPYTGTRAQQQAFVRSLSNPDLHQDLASLDAQAFLGTQGRACAAIYHQEVTHRQNQGTWPRETSEPLPNWGTGAVADAQAAEQALTDANRIALNRLLAEPLLTLNLLTYAYEHLRDTEWTTYKETGYTALDPVAFLNEKAASNERQRQWGSSEVLRNYHLLAYWPNQPVAPATQQLRIL